MLTRAAGKGSSTILAEAEERCAKAAWEPRQAACLGERTAARGSWHVRLRLPAPAMRGLWRKGPSRALSAPCWLWLHDSSCSLHVEYKTPQSPGFQICMQGWGGGRIQPGHPLRKQDVGGADAVCALGPHLRVVALAGIPGCGGGAGGGEKRGR